MWFNREQAHKDVDWVFNALDQAQEPPRARGLNSLRRVTQQTVALRMGISQPAVSQLERRQRIEEKTLRSYVEACGATLVLVARQPDGQLVPLDVEIIN